LKLYSCELDLPADEVCSNLTLKVGIQCLVFSLYQLYTSNQFPLFWMQLLSLQGKAEVLVDKLKLTVTEDH